MSGYFLLILLLPGLAGAAGSNICKIFNQHPDWHTSALKAEKRWHIAASDMMAVIHQESHFRDKATPSHSSLFQWIPWVSDTNAYGYAQATNATWRWYCQDQKRLSADRSRFADAIDFVGWYLNKAHKTLGIAENQIDQLYLAYHEGLNGYRSGSYRHKLWLRAVSIKVKKQAQRYQQLDDLKPKRENP